MKTIAALRELLDVIQAEIKTVDEKAEALLHPNDPTATYHLESTNNLLVRELGFVYQILNLVYHALLSKPNKDNALTNPIDALIFILNNIAPLFESALLFGLKPLIDQFRLTPASAAAIKDEPLLSDNEFPTSIAEIAAYLKDRKKLVQAINDLSNFMLIVPNALIKKSLEKWLFTEAAQAEMSKAFDAESQHCTTDIKRELRLVREKNELEPVGNNKYILYPQQHWQHTFSVTLQHLEQATQQPLISEPLLDFYHRKIEPWMSKFFSDSDIIDELTACGNSSKILRGMFKGIIKSFLNNAKEKLELKKKEKAAAAKAHPDQLPNHFDSHISFWRGRKKHWRNLSTLQFIRNNLQTLFKDIIKQAIPATNATIKSAANRTEQTIDTLCKKHTGYHNTVDLRKHVAQLELDHNTARQVADADDPDAISTIATLQETITTLIEKLHAFKIALTQSQLTASPAAVIHVAESSWQDETSRWVKINRKEIDAKPTVPGEVTELNYADLAPKENVDLKSKKFHMTELTPHKLGCKFTMDVTLDFTQSIGETYATTLRSVTALMARLKKCKSALHEQHSRCIKIAAKAATAKRAYVPKPIPTVPQSQALQVVPNDITYKYALHSSVDTYNDGRQPLVIYFNHPLDFFARFELFMGYLPYQVLTAEKFTPSTHHNTSLVVQPQHGMLARCSLTPAIQQFFVDLWQYESGYRVLMEDMKNFPAEMQRVTDEKSEQGDYLRNLAFYHQIAQVRLQNCQQTLQSYTTRLQALARQQQYLLSNTQLSDSRFGKYMLARHQRIISIMQKHNIKLTAAKQTITDEMTRLSDAVKTKVQTQIKHIGMHAAVTLYESVKLNLEYYFELRRKVFKYRVYDAYCSLFNVPSDEQIRRQYANELSWKLYYYVQNRDDKSLTAVNELIESGLDKFDLQTKEKVFNYPSYQKTLHFALTNIKSLVANFARQHHLSQFTKHCEQQSQQESERLKNTGIHQRAAPAA